MVAVPLTVLSFFRTSWLLAAHIDTQATTVLVILLVLLLGFSFAISGAEVAFFSLTGKDINLLKTKQQPAYKRIVDLLENPRLLLASFIIANCIANIAIIIIANIVIDDLVILDNDLFWVHFLIKVVSITVLLLLFCEVMPKVMATQNNIRFAKDVGFLVETTGYAVNWLSKIAISYLNIADPKSSARNDYAMQELDEAIDKSSDADTSEKEKSILKGIAKFGNITVKQVMKTRIDVSGIELSTNFQDLIAQVEDLHYSRLPVYKENLDEVTGIINTKDLLPYLDSPASFDWHFLMRQPLFVHEQKLIEDLLKEFQAKRIHIAVVVDEFGGTSGIVTLEDILEEVIGDIKDEFDEEEEDASFTKIDDRTFLFDGKTMIYDVCKAMNLPLTTFDQVKGDSDSLAGLVLELAGEIPKQGEVVNSGDFDFTVIQVEKNRLQKVKVAIISREA